MITTRNMLTKALQNGSYICTGDIQQAFMQTEPARTPCVAFPKGVTAKLKVSPSSPGGANHRRVRLVLLKALYGLKQSPLLWLQELDKLFAANGYTRSTSGPCLFFKIDKDGDRLECVVFVDNLLVVFKCVRMIKIFKTALGACFNNNIGVVPWD